MINTPVVSDSSTLAVLSLSTPSGLHSECLSVPAHRSVIAGAVIRFANQHGIAASMVQVGMLYSDQPLPAVAA